MGDVLTVIVVVGLILFAIYTIKRYVSKLGKGGCCGTSGDGYKPKDRNIKNYPIHVSLDVEGMHCVNCAKLIEDAFQSRGGILAKANDKTGHVELYFKEDMSDEKITSIIEKNGYEVKLIRR